MPDIEYAFLADYAQVQPGSKFHILGGGISRLAGPSFPFVHPHLSIVVGLRLTSTERTREHDLGFVVTAPDGADVASADVASAAAVTDPRTPTAAYAPDGTLIALLTEESGQARPLVVFA